ncbi:MAG TPA: DNA-binding protein [Clostridiaceae bacterium]|jgi:uncharacterized protein YjdB|nr:DNA-binding protein [Clostridiaceae bacterium]HBF77119.1 DNA-binding protein [Clostridiaceae bacterium]HBG38804.1 DNA-binding protein [Clostridiaceae bacterium]HBN28661.1 DNA-binding protein [Clostridiaceae bacterium]HBX47373.1 DNA-binding protein [Clostridiaceae bacterium]
MKGRKKNQVLSWIMIFTLLLSSFASLGGLNAAEAAEKIPDILITEIVPKHQGGDDPYEFIEIYNTTNKDINLNGYSFWDNSPAKFDGDKILPAKGVMVVNTFGTSVDDFNKEYNTTLTDNEYYAFSKKSLLGNKGKELDLKDSASTKIVSASYTGGDVQDGKSIIFKCPSSGTTMEKIANGQDPTPGIVLDGQLIDDTPQQPIPLTGLLIDETLKLEVDKSEKLNLVYEPSDTTEKEVKWESSDTDIAEVLQDGTVTGKTVGNAVITVTSTTNDAIKAECNVAVKEEEPVQAETISDVRKEKEGTEVEVQGVVTYNDRNQTVYIQDSTAGIALSNHSVGDIDDFKSLKPGNEVKVKGKLGNFHKLLQVTISEKVTIINENAGMPQPKVVTIAEANTGNYESQLIKIEKAVIDIENKKLTQGEDKLDIFFIPAGINVKTGDLVDTTAVIGRYDNTIQIYGGSAVFTKAEEIDTEKPVITHDPVLKGNISENLKISATITDNKEVKLAKVYYRVKGQTEFKSVDMTNSETIYTGVIPKEELSKEGMEYYIEASDGSNNISRVPDDISKPYFIEISDEDKSAPIVKNLNPKDGSSTGNNFKPEISAEYEDISGIDANSVKLYLDEKLMKAEITESKVKYIPDSDLAKGNHLVKIEVSDKKGNKGEYTWSFSVGQEEYNHYYGQIHSHTNYSDGTGTPDEAYAYAKDNAKADFFAVTDHSNWFDNDKQGRFFIDNDPAKGENDCPTSEKWTKLHQIADKYNEEGKFAAIAGFEMTWSGSTGGWGHINTFNTKGFETRSNSDVDLKTYYDKISKLPNSISQLNHPGKTFGDFADFGFYSKAADKVVDLVEVGNGEGPVRGSGYFPSYEYYTRALDKGWHLAPTNNQDNHKGKWVNANTARTVMLAQNLTRDNIYDSMRNMRVYSTEDENMKINYTVNGKPMGSFLNNPDKLDFVIDINDPDPDDRIGKVSIIVNGGAVIDSKDFDKNSAHWEFSLDPQYDYYYVRVDEKDKDIAVTAPVWVGDASPAGIGKVEVSQDPQYVNVPVDITATLYNNTQETINDIKVEFYKNVVSSENKIGEQSISSLEPTKEAIAKINWTPGAAGEYKIYVQATMNVAGTQKVFTNSISFTAANKEDFKKVVIDAAHSNQYVSGDYKGKMTNLKEMLKQEKTMIVENTSEFNSEALENTSILIITPPQSTDDSKNNLTKKKFTDDEIKAIKDYADKGGSLIITSRADYKDGTGDYQRAVQGNKILEAIGSNLRFNDDEVVDNTKNGGQPFRLYFDNYTSTKYNLTEGIPDGELYSFYSGCSTILKENADDKNVDILVKGHETTETLDSDNKGDNTPVNKGDVIALAAEILPSGGKVVVGGTTFFSDFETETGDNAYSNIKITESIINWLAPKKEAELKTIAEVRKDENNDGIPDNMGKNYAIDGYVTSQSEAVSPKNAFFEVIYVQDETGGITVFGVSKTPLPIGTKVRIVGTVSQYENDSQIALKDETNDVIILDSNVKPVEPKIMSTKDSMLEKNEGWLVKVQGKVKRIDNEKNSLYIDDGTGGARVYLNGYIWDGKDESTKGKWNKSINVGDTVSAVGLASEDMEGHRLRVRNTAEIVKVTGGGGDIPSTPGEDIPPTPTVINVAGVKLNKNNISLEVGQTETLTASVEPSNATNTKVRWNSSDGKVASVSDGKITAIKAGEAVITVTTEDGEKTDSCIVKVKEKETPPSGSGENPKEDDHKKDEDKPKDGDKEQPKESIVENKDKKAVVSNKGNDKGSSKKQNISSAASILVNDPNTKNKIKEQINDKSIKEILVDASSESSIDKEIFESLKGQDKDITFIVKDEKTNMEFSWTFNGKDIKDDAELKNIDLSIKDTSLDVLNEIKQFSEDAVVFTLSDNDTLPASAKLKIKLPETLKNEKTLYFYYFNAKDKKFEEEQKVDVVDGCIDAVINHCSDYVISKTEIKNKENNDKKDETSTENTKKVVSEKTEEKPSSNAKTTVIIIIVIAAAATVIYAVIKKKNK